MTTQTREDRTTWGMFLDRWYPKVLRYGPVGGMSILSDDADRRDAELMLALRRWGFVRRLGNGVVLFNLDPPRHL